MFDPCCCEAVGFPFSVGCRVPLCVGCNAPDVLTANMLAAVQVTFVYSVLYLSSSMTQRTMSGANVHGRGGSLFPGLQFISSKGCLKKNVRIDFMGPGGL